MTNNRIKKSEGLHMGIDDLASEEHAIRVEKIKKMREVGIEPWPAVKEINATTKDVLDEFRDDKESREYAIAGRVMALRKHGKTIFAHIQDFKGRLQIYIRKDILGDVPYSQFVEFVDIGDILWIYGHSFKTKTGEITLKVTSFTLESKCLHPLPEKFHGITDIEIKYRQRYLDLITSQESRERFIRRSNMMRVMRNFFDEHGYLEVETPMLHPIPGGAAAKPFVTHHNALDTDLYLRIAPELYLKRLVVGGFERVYEINRSFRNEGVSTKHNPEFTMVEFYTAYKDYHFAMDFVEKMIRHIVMETGDSLRLPFGNIIIDFQRPFRRLSMKDAVLEYGMLSEQDISSTNMDALLRSKSITHPNKNAVWGEKLFLLFEELVEPHLIEPTFITDYPIEISPLAKRDPDNPSMAARFELFIAGMELSNGFNELNDPFDQAERFRRQVKARDDGDAEAHCYDADYIQTLEYGLPPTTGVGLGIDRLTMLLTNTTSIKDVILFPALKRKVQDHC